MRTVILLILVLALIASGEGAEAGSPAHPTLLLLQQKVDMIKIGDDVNAQWVLGVKNLGENASVSYYNWDSQDSGKRLQQYSLVVKVSPSTQVGVTSEQWEGAEGRTSVFADTTKEGVSLACVAPIGDPAKSTIGLRCKVGNDLTAYGKFCKNSKPMFGLSYSKAVTIDVAYGDKVSYVRFSKAFGRYTPEARFRFTPAENFYGGAVCVKFN